MSPGQIKHAEQTVTRTAQMNYVSVHFVMVCNISDKREFTSNENRSNQYGVMGIHEVIMESRKLLENLNTV